MAAIAFPVISFPFLLCGALAASSPAAAGDCRASVAWAPVIELYTSQGCSSCPPADAWLGSLADAALAHRVVPLSFHVDYWNQLGWRDPFSQAAHSARQRSLARAEGGTVVYTPQVRLAGADFRGWRSADAVRAALASRPSTPAGAADLTVDARGAVLTVEARTALPAGRVGYLAIYERALGSNISAGENAGRQLTHDFVVRRLFGPFPADARGRLAVRQDVPVDAAWKRADLGAALLQADAVSGAALLGAALPSCT